jgi:putative transposase
MTFYSEVLHGKIGEGDFQRIYRLCLNLDKLISKILKAKCKQKRRLKQAAERMRWKIFDLIDELHKKTANFLVRTFNRIFIPIPTFVGTGSLKLHKWLQNWLQVHLVTC